VTSLDEVNVEATTATHHTHVVDKITIAVARRDFILSQLSIVRIWLPRRLSTGAETRFDRSEQAKSTEDFVQSVADATSVTLRRGRK
jgi:hypothetical protein